MNQLESLAVAFKINEQTLKHTAERLKRNPHDPIALDTQERVLTLIRNDAYESIYVHKDKTLFIEGKRIYDLYAKQPLTIIEGERT